MKKDKRNEDLLEEAENLTEEIARELEEAEAEKAAGAEDAENDADAEQAEAGAGEAADGTAEAGPADPRDAKIAELQDRLMRQMAEFDNYRKRTDREKSEMFDLGAKHMAEKILPSIDDFERGLASLPEDPEARAFAEGMHMIYTKMMKSLEDAGVKPIECVGQPFDPAFHNAVMHEEDDSGEENVVTAELQKGYLYKDSVLRHSMVKVKN